MADPRGRNWDGTSRPENHGRKLTALVTLVMSVSMYLASGIIAWIVVQNPATTDALMLGIESPEMLTLAKIALILFIGGVALAPLAFIIGSTAVRIWAVITTVIPGLPSGALSTVGLLFLI